jgi:hypothetical protein
MNREDWQGPRSALIIAADHYDDPSLARLRAPSRDARELESILADQSIGNYQVPPILLNKPAQDVREAIESFFADAGTRHTLLLYLSCHGIRNERNQLRFATTTTKVSRLESTSITAEFVAEQMERSLSRRIAVLLDCCYSGAFPAGLRAMSGDEVSLDPLWAAAPQGRGRVVITSSRATEYAFEPRTDGRVSERVLTRAAPSVFTDAVVAGLRSGHADRDGDGWVTVQELYDYVHDCVRERAPHQTPQIHGRIEGRFAIARNPAAGTAPGTGPVLPEPRRRHAKVILGAVALLAAGIAVSWFSMGPGRNGGVRIPLTVNTCAGVARVPSAAVRLGALPTGRPGITKGSNNDYVGATFAPDCHLMAAAGNGQERILNLVAGLQTATLPVNKGHWVFGAAFTPDSKTLAVASNDGVTELWDVTSGQQLASLSTDPNGGTWGLALSPDGNTLVTGGSDGLVEFWDVATHTQIRKISVPGIGSLAISPNGKLVAVGGADGIERLLRLHNGTQLTTLNSHAGNAFSVAFSPDSRTLAAATNSGVQWWDINSGKLIAQETGAATDVAFSPDGKILAVGGKDSVVLRDASTHRAIATLSLGSAGVWVTGVTFSRYGGVLAVGWNGTLQFWNVAGVSRLT